jgi:hypothetical protein
MTFCTLSCFHHWRLWWALACTCLHVVWQHISQNRSSQQLSFFKLSNTVATSTAASGRRIKSSWSGAFFTISPAMTSNTLGPRVQLACGGVRVLAASVRLFTIARQLHGCFNSYQIFSKEHLGFWPSFYLVQASWLCVRSLRCLSH